MILEMSSSKRTKFRRMALGIVDNLTGEWDIETDVVGDDDDASS